MPLEVHPHFAVPIAQDHQPDAALNAELKALILAREAEGARWRNPTPSLTLQPEVYESEFEFFSWPEPCVQRLKQFCWQALGATIQRLNGYDAERMRRLRIFSHTWFHVTRHGGFTVLHSHPMASWSGVYCVDPGETPPDRPESGVLRFHNPHQYGNYFMDAGNARLAHPFHYGTWSVRFQAGQLVLFPSWLLHEVLPFFGGDTRITVAFNCWFALPE